MKKLLSILFLFAFSSPVFSQLSSDSISIRQSGSKMEFIQNNRLLKLREVQFIMQSNQEASNRFSQAQFNNYISYAFQMIGAGLIGYSFGYAISGNDLNYYTLGAGVATMLFSKPFSNAFRNQAESAVKIYNGQVGSDNSTSLHFGFTSNGIGFTLLLE